MLPATSVAVQVGRQVPQVGQAQRVRVGRRHVSGVRRDHVEHAAHGEVVFAAILRGVGESGCRVGVGRGIRKPSGGARQDSRAHVAAADPHERLRTRPEESVDGEGERVGVGRAQSHERPALVGHPADIGNQIAGDHDLVQPSRADALPRRGHGALEHLRGHAARHKSRGEVGARGARFDRVTAVDSGDPRHAVAAAHDDARHGKDARLGRLVTEREAAKRNEAGSRQSYLVGDVGGGAQLAPPGREVGDSAIGVRTEAGALTKPDDAVAVAQKYQRMVRPGPLKQVAIEVEAFGVHRQHLGDHSNQRSRPLRTLAVNRSRVLRNIIRWPHHRLDPWPKRI